MPRTPKPRTNLTLSETAIAQATEIAAHIGMSGSKILTAVCEQAIARWWREIRDTTASAREHRGYVIDIYTDTSTREWFADICGGGDTDCNEPLRTVTATTKADALAAARREIDEQIERYGQVLDADIEAHRAKE